MRETICGHYPYRAKGLCQKCYSAAYHQANRERIIASVADWAKTNPEKRKATTRKYRRSQGEAWRERQREYYRLNAEKLRAGAKARHEADPDRRRELQRSAENRRRARKAGSDPDLTLQEWEAILEEFDHRCAYCHRSDLPLQQEHMTPLSRGGRHTASNVVPACGPCNKSKRSRTAFEFIGPRVLLGLPA